MAVRNDRNETPPVWMLLFSVGGILAVGGRAGIRLCWYLLTAHLVAIALWRIISTIRGRVQHDDHLAPKGDDKSDVKKTVPRVSWQPITFASSGRSGSHDRLKRNVHNVHENNPGAFDQSDVSPFPAGPSKRNSRSKRPSKRNPRSKRRLTPRRKRSRSYMQKK